MHSTFDHPSVIDAYLENEVSCGQVAGPFSSPPFTDLHIIRFGVVPKNNQPGKWCLILDLSSPDGHSINDGIPKSPLSIQYITADAFINGIIAPGCGTLLATFDVASAYRNVAIHPLDRLLLCMKWRDKYYVDMALPFGLWSVPYISPWCWFPSALFRWLSHAGSPASSVCYNNLQACIQLCSKLGLPLHLDKLEGPSTCLYVLGIKLNSVRLQARLPIDKREFIVTLLESWSGKHFCKRQELESLIGHLHHACKIAPQGRTFPVAWLTFCVLSDVMIIPFVWTRNFTWTLLGGANFSTVGMGSASSWCLNGLPSLIFKFPLTLPACWVMEPSSSISGAAVCGQHLSNPCLLCTRSSFPLLWLHTCGVLNGLLGRLSSCATMSQWWLFCLLAPPETPN